jgi:hypothetical protein|nr:MAG TPA: hypothetical protein [Caudoviricetes sp.]
MQKTYLVNGKVTYPQQGGSKTTFHLTNFETGEIFTISTDVDSEADSLDYGDKVTMTLDKIVENQPAEGE